MYAKVLQNVMMWETYPGGLHLLLAALGTLDVVPIELQGP